MKLPQRVDRHISETSSFKIFSNNIPDSWIIREITERDYGVDCYIELVDRNNQVTGELISIQLKGVQEIKWTKENYFTLSGVNISTSNYWYRFPTPVFVLLVDIGKREIFFTPVKSYIRKNFISYAKQEHFSYKIHKKMKLDEENLSLFLYSYFKEKRLGAFEVNLTTFVSHFFQYKDFIDENIGRDCFMGVDGDRVLYLRHLYNNIMFLCGYFNISHKMLPFKDYSKKSRERFGDDYYIYEQQVDEVATGLYELIPQLLESIKKHLLEIENEYWTITDINVLKSVLYLNTDWL